MIQSLKTISEISQYLIEKFNELELVSAYCWTKGITIFQNNIEADFNISAFRLFCLNSLGRNRKDYEDNDNIIIDYGDQGLMALYQFTPGSWLIIAASKKRFPLVNLEVKKIDRKSINFDIEEIHNKEASPEVEKKVAPEKSSNDSESKKLLAAKKLQQSILPDLSVLEQYFSKYFSYYRPENILSGDFYWLRDTSDSIYIVVADCKGHDMEAALMTITINNILNDRVGKNPKVSIKNIYEGLNTYSEDSTIVVEMAICRYVKSTGDIEIATSGIRVLYIENEENYNLIKIKGSQNKDLSKAKIESIKLNVNKGDKIILYSDGLADQFDANQKNKLGNVGIRNMFISMNGGFSREKFENDFTQWKGETKQIDDITVLAFQI